MPVLQIDSAAFSYDGKTDIFKGLSCEISSGEIFCILGPNGTGKSTLLRALANLSPLREGVVRLDGRDIRRVKPRELARRIALIPQEVSLTFPYKVTDVVLMGRTPHLNSMARPSESDYRKALDAIALMGLESVADRPCTQLSGGQLQLVMLARAVAQEADFLLLDEPTSHLDYGRQMAALRTIKQMHKRGVGIIMTTHDPNHAFLICDRVALMNRGGFTAVGSPDQIVTSANLRDTYGADVEVVQHGGRKLCVPMTEL